MEWNGDLKPFLSWPENSFSYLHNFKDDPYQGGEMKYPAEGEAEAAMQKNSKYGNGGSGEGKKKKLTSKQLESLESSFQMEIKLEPERKIKLAKELGLQPRQVAVWFQNRRARWKSKQLEHLYNSLKLQFDVVNKEKQMLQQEVLALKAVMNLEGSKKPVSTCCTEISGEETVESTSVAKKCPKEPQEAGGHHDQITECSHAFYFDEYGPSMTLPPYIMPSHP